MFQVKPPCTPPLTIMNSTVTTVESFRFLGSTISQDLKWDIRIDSIVKKAQQRLYFLCQLRKFNLPQELPKQFYSAIIESVLCTSITVWFSSATKSDLRRLQRVVWTAERTIGTTLPTLQELYLSRVSKRDGKITLHPSHPARFLFELLPSGRCNRALSTRTTRHRNSFFPQAIHLMNIWTLDNKHETHNTSYIYLFNTYTYYILNLHLTYLYILTGLLCLCYFAHCLFSIFVYYNFVLSVSCLVTVILSHCGASITNTNSSYVQTYLAIKLILILILIIKWTIKIKCNPTNKSLFFFSILR